MGDRHRPSTAAAEAPSGSSSSNGTPTGGSGTEAKLLTAQEVAELLGVSHEYVWQLSREGRIPTITLGRVRRYRRASILEWLERIESSGSRA